jgi:valyl-tRNA synthetase
MPASMKMMSIIVPEKYRGLDRFEARKQIVSRF